MSNPQQTQAGQQPQAQHAQRAAALGINLDDVLHVLEAAGSAAPVVLDALKKLVGAFKGGA